MCLEKGTRSCIWSYVVIIIRMVHVTVPPATRLQAIWLLPVAHPSVLRGVAVFRPEASMCWWAVKMVAFAYGRTRVTGYVGSRSCFFFARLLSELVYLRWSIEYFIDRNSRLSQGNPTLPHPFHTPSPPEGLV